jgi:mono/diheme cytochrome c family protein
MRFRVGAALAFLALSWAFQSALAGRQEQRAADPATQGQHVYDETCSRCHGAAGRGGKAPELVPFGWNYSQALDIVRHGGTCGMPAFKESELGDEDVKAIVDYLKSLN